MPLKLILVLISTSNIFTGYMSVIKILASPRTVLFSDLHPFFRWKKELKDQGIDVSFHYDHKKLNLTNRDHLIINNRYFRGDWVKSSGNGLNDYTKVIEYLKQIKQQTKKLFWWDANDTSVSSSFAVIPYVDLFIKNQVLKDKNYYTAVNNPPNLRVWINPEVEQKQFVPCPKDQLYKIKLSWNLGYNDRRYFPFKLHHYLSNITPYSIKPLRFTSVDTPRNLDLTFRGKANYDKQFPHVEAVSTQRNKVFDLLGSLNLNVTFGTVVSRKQYLKELSHSKICISPFGYGEVCYRDFETFIAGSLLIKPSMEHLETFPNFYIPNETYIPVAWDLHDLRDKAEDAILNYAHQKEIARNGQEFYRKVVNDPKIFIDSLIKLIE